MSNNGIGAIVIAIAVTVVGGLVVLVVQKDMEAKAALPKLVFKSTTEGDGYADILAESESTKPFIVYWVQYRFRATIQEAPQAVPARPTVPQRPRTRPTLRDSRNHMAGAPITPDDVTVQPSRIDFDQWIDSGFDPVQVPANTAERLRFSIKDKAHAGGVYWVDVAAGYGDMKAPNWMFTKPFRIRVVAR